MDRIGQQFGSYRLISLLGSGGFADVYLGKQVHLESLAAIKLLHTNLTQKEVEDFRLEARTLVSLIHPHIIRLLEFALEDNVPFLVMDYAPNGTLRQRHRAGEKLPLATIVSYVNQIGSALQHAHDRKIIHRDIKPGNMLIGQSNNILISDFGIAFSLYNGPSVSQHDGLGTPAYIAPEQIQGQACPASDQYALGIVVYEWLRGKQPFRGTNIEVWGKHRAELPPPLRQQVPDLSSFVESVVLKALSKDPYHRFTTIAEFAQALREASQMSAAVIKPTQPTQTVTSAVMPLSPIPKLSIRVPLPDLPYVHKGHTDRVNAVSWSPDGRYIASASRDRTVQIWNVANGRGLFKFNNQADSIHGVAWSPDGTRIACAFADQTVQVWSATQGYHLLTCHGHSGWVYGVAWSPDSTRIVSASQDKTVQIWDAAHGRSLFTYRGHSGCVYGVAWSPDGTRIVSASQDRTAQVWNAANGRLLFTYGEHARYVVGVAWSPDSTRIASASLDKTVQIWDGANGHPLFTYRGHSSSVYGVAWSSDGVRIASASGDGAVQVWNASNGKYLFTYHEHAQAVESLAWSPDGTCVASASQDGTVRIWRVPVPE